MSQFGMSGSAPSEYTIDQLAATARVPSRTIRFYQARRALPAPEIRGRVAWYGPAHLERLQLIAQLQDRGLRIAAIVDLLASIDRGEIDLAEWLGVERQVQASWSDDAPRTLTTAELHELAGTRRPGLLADLVRAGLVERRGDVLLLRSPGLLAVAMKLEAAGMGLDVAAAAAAVVRKHMAKMAGALVDDIVQHVAAGTVAAPDLEALLRTVRGAGIEAVRILFGHEMERAMRRLVASGKLAALPARVARKAKRRA
ncbi:MerR family transcriptional regulator [Nannocystis pusilla]